MASRCNVVVVQVDLAAAAKDTRVVARMELGLLPTGLTLDQLKQSVANLLTVMGAMPGREATMETIAIRGHDARGRARFP